MPTKKPQPAPVSSETVKAFIVEKFGTLPRFAALADRNATNLTVLLKRKTVSPELVALQALAEKTENKTTCAELSSEDREALATFLETCYHGNASAFARAKQGVDSMTISHILKGVRKRKTDQVRAVYEAAGLPLSDSCHPVAKQPLTGNAGRKLVAS